MEHIVFAFQRYMAVLISLTECAKCDTSYQLLLAIHKLGP